MQNLLIIVILLVILIPAALTAVKHMKGEGSCCGGPKEKVPRKKLDAPKLGAYQVAIEGMHCQNCKNRIEKHLNELDGVVSKVNLEKKTALVTYCRPVEPETIRKVIEDLDFTVVDLKKAE